MKAKVVKFKKTVVFIVFAAWGASSFAQVNTMYVMKNGIAVFHSPVSGIDNVTFDEATPGDTLIVHKNDGLPSDKILLNNIQQLSFSDENLFVETLNGNDVYGFSNIAKLVFSNIGTIGINRPTTQNNIDVLVYLTPDGNMIVKSFAVIKSLSLFSADGKMISMYNLQNKSSSIKKNKSSFF